MHHPTRTYKTVTGLLGTVLLVGCAGSGPTGSTVAAVSPAGLTVDLNCDASADQIHLMVSEDAAQATVELTLGATKGMSRLRFSLQGEGHKNSLCGGDVVMLLGTTDSAAVQAALGELPRGYRADPQCPELILQDGECSDIHLYWDHARHHLNWWRE